MESLDTKKVIFLDRDGVINHEVNYLRNIEEFKFIDGIFDSCLHFINKGFNIIIVTNQSGIAKGFITEDEFNYISRWMINEFNKRKINILDIFFCPHNSDSKCECRKPSPGMFFKAKEKHNINMKKSWAIGDKESDIKAANMAGIYNTILVKSGHKIDQKNTQSKFCLESVKDAISTI